MKSRPLIAILGCGPAGMLAAHACAMHHVPFVIFSPKVKSVLGGAQYSHIKIPIEYELDEADAKLTYIVRGDADTYQKKVYADTPVKFVSFSKVHDGKIVPAWNLGKLYDQVWDLYHDQIVDVKLEPEQIVGFPSAFDLVFSSVPLKSICLGFMDPSLRHWFRDTTIRVYNEAIEDIPDNTIVYDGTDEHSYYRMSKIFGVGSTEWGANVATPPLPNLRTINKPTGTNCNCYTRDLGGGIPEVIRIGRFGTWNKGELTFHAFNRVLDTLSQIGVIDG